MKNNKIDIFVELGEPEPMGGRGWFIASVDPIQHGGYEYYYLHNDGYAYAGCADNGSSTGWFEDREDAAAAREQYYLSNKNTSRATTNACASQPMVFK